MITKSEIFFIYYYFVSVKSLETKGSKINRIFTLKTKGADVDRIFAGFAFAHSFLTWQAGFLPKRMSHKTLTSFWIIALFLNFSPNSIVSSVTKLLCHPLSSNS